ncbi:heparan sulfate 2-O-sulfotransferase 1, partial [Tachysurus ichikawai]
MGTLRIMMAPKFQLLALMTFAVTMLFLENQIHQLEESKGKL